MGSLGTWLPRRNASTFSVLIGTLFFPFALLYFFLVKQLPSFFIHFNGFLLFSFAPVTKISYSNGFAYFFKGAQYYRFNPRNESVDTGYPRTVSSYWKGVPSDMEGVLPWHNGGVYVFKDTQNWFFLHSSQSIGVSSSYPKSIMQWWSDDTELTGYTALRYVLIKTMVS